jgi:hypothetical protein
VWNIPEASSDDDDEAEMDENPPTPLEEVFTLDCTSRPLRFVPFGGELARCADFLSSRVASVCVRVRVKILPLRCKCGIDPHKTPPHSFGTVCGLGCCAVCSFGWHPTSADTMMSLDPKKLSMWDVTGSKAADKGSAAAPEGEEFECCRWNPHHGAAFVATASGSGVRCWDTRTMEQTGAILGAHAGAQVRTLDFNPNKQVNSEPRAVHLRFMIVATPLVCSLVWSRYHGGDAAHSWSTPRRSIIYLREETTGTSSSGTFERKTRRSSTLKFTATGCGLLGLITITTNSSSHQAQISKSDCPTLGPSPRCCTPNSMKTMRTMKMGQTPRPLMD